MSGRQAPAEDQASAASPARITASPTSPSASDRFPFRGLLAGLLLAPLCAYWLVQCEVIWYSGYPSGLALPANLVVFLLFLVALNLGFRRYAPRLALSAQDLGMAWIVLAVVTGLSGMPQIPWLFPCITYPFYGASRENQWQQRLWPNLPEWLTVRDKQAVDSFYLGHASILQPGTLKAWLLPLTAWGLFICALFLVTLCLAALVRRQWNDHERLSYPLLEVPLALMRGGGDVTLLRNPLLWLGAAFAGGLCLYNGFAFLYPNLPFVNTKVHQIGQDLPPPWNQMGWSIFTFYTFAIGLGYFLPTDLAFSVWFFFILRKLQPVFAATQGWEFASDRYFGYRQQQAVGAILGLFLVLVWTARSHLRAALRRALSRRRQGEDHLEPIPYRLALAGLVIGSVLLIVFLNAAGMAPWLAAGYLAVYLAINVAIVQMRAQAGPPYHDFYGASPNVTALTLVGARSLPTPTLAAFSMLGFMNWVSSSHPMQQQVEAFRFSDRLGLRRRPVAMTLACLLPVGLLLAFFLIIAISYRDGSPSGWWGKTGRAMFTYFDTWSKTRPEADVPGTLFLSGSLLFTVMLGLARLRFLWWPFHPVGYTLGNAVGIDYVWMPIFLAWITKSLVLRFGGLRLFRRASPLFIGLVVGEYTIGSMWQVLSLLLRKPMYSFWPY